MSFKTRKIKHRSHTVQIKKLKGLGARFFSSFKNISPKKRNYIAASLLVIFGVFVVFKVSTAAYRFVADFTPTNLLKAVGEDLKKDEYGYTNILLLGDGGHVRDGADLIDTIMVASIDYEKNAVSLLSIPRDLYLKRDTELGVEYASKINELYRNHLNSMPEEERFQLFKRVVGSIVNLDIHYYMRVDFNAFVAIVDSLDGVTIDVQESIYDPYYPNETDDGYTVFSVDEGVQEMDGETALKFARSRKTTSDFARAARQQLLLEAIQQKALSKDVLTSPSTIKNVYTAISDNINTDMTLREMVSLGAFAKEMDRSRLVRKLIHDDPGREGGFLYTPERELYNGQFVLIPYGNNYDIIHKYTDLVFHQREIFYEPARIKILNGTKTSGIAYNALYQLNRFAFQVNGYANYLDENEERQYVPESFIEYFDWTEDKSGLTKPKYQATLNALEGFVKASEMPSDSAYLISGEGQDKQYEGGEVNISIILGEDYEVFLVN